MGGIVGKSESPKKVCTPETKLEAKIVEAMKRRAIQGTSMKSFDNIILKFPKIDESLRNCKAIFELFGKSLFVTTSIVSSFLWCPMQKHT